MKLGIVASHPIQYQAVWFRQLAARVNLTVYFAHSPTAQQQAVGFDRSFTWDVDLLSGYSNRFLKNRARTPSTQVFWGCDTPEIRHIVRTERFDAVIVCGWNLLSFWQTVFACRKYRVPVLVRGDSQMISPRSVLKRVAKRVAYPRLLRAFDAFLYVGQRNAAYLRTYGAREDKMFFVPHFVDNDWFAVQAKRGHAQRHGTREGWGATPSTTVALFVGKLIPKKRPVDLLLAIEALSNARHDVIAVLVGSGQLEKELRDLADKRGLRVVFDGFRNQSEMPGVYAAADLLVLPSDGAETWGLVVNEAMACGLPAVVSDAAGCAPDLIDDGLTGYTFPLADVGGLVEALSKAILARRGGVDFTSHLVAKMKAYCADVATEGTVRAISALKVAY